MIRKIAAQERVLPRMCKVLNFHFDFDILNNYVAEIEYIQDMNAENVSDEELYPISMFAHGNDVWYLFRKSFQDRVYCLSIFEDTDDVDTSNESSFSDSDDYLNDHFNHCKNPLSHAKE